MIRLSQRGWNNVIIFITLILILLFNFSSDFLNRDIDDKSAVATLIPSDWVVTTLEFEHDTVERIGQGWRAKSGNMAHDELIQLLNHWHNAEVELFDSNINWQSEPQIVKIWFAGKSEPIEYEFTAFADTTLVKIDQQTYRLISPTFSLLNIDI